MALTPRVQARLNNGYGVLDQQWGQGWQATMPQGLQPPGQPSVALVIALRRLSLEPGCVPPPWNALQAILNARRSDTRRRGPNPPHLTTMDVDELRRQGLGQGQQAGPGHGQGQGQGQQAGQVGQVGQVGQGGLGGLGGQGGLEQQGEPEGPEGQEGHKGQEELEQQERLEQGVEGEQGGIGIGRLGRGEQGEQEGIGRQEQQGKQGGQEEHVQQGELGQANKLGLGGPVDEDLTRDESLALTRKNDLDIFAGLSAKKDRADNAVLREKIEKEAYVNALAVQKQNEDILKDLQHRYRIATADDHEQNVAKALVRFRAAKNRLKLVTPEERYLWGKQQEPGLLSELIRQSAEADAAILNTSICAIENDIAMLADVNNENIIVISKVDGREGFTYYFKGDLISRKKVHSPHGGSMIYVIELRDNQATTSTMVIRIGNSPTVTRWIAKYTHSFTQRELQGWHLEGT
ncbi:MAG: hypothetical protein M1827_001844 [Pycnora praestabilis]|nr:MAG: hypothetical protein M1827_001844 [Pycnora praestabilis]